MNPQDTAGVSLPTAVEEVGVSDCLQTSNGGAAPLQPRDPELDAGLRRLADLVMNQVRLQPAWEFAKELLERWPDSPQVQHYVRVLAPSTARRRPDLPNIDRSREWQWLKQHARAYPGQWLAVLGDELVAADPDAGVVIDKVRSDPRYRDAILHYQMALPK